MRYIVALSVLLMTVSTAMAQSQYAPPYAGYAGSMPNPYGQNYRNLQRPAKGPSGVLRQGIIEIRTYLARNKRTTPNDLARFVEDRIAPYFNFTYMTQSSLGPTWRRISPADRNHAKAMLRQNLLVRLTEYIADYRAARIDVLSAHGGNSRGEMVVPVRIQRQNAPPMSLNFRFYKDKAGWRIFDVSANGQSAVIFYRGYLNRTLRQRR